VIELLKALRYKQMTHLLDALEYLYRSTTYSLVDSSLALDGSIDNCIKSIEKIIREENEK
jgi:hypothetical protein